VKIGWHLSAAGGTSPPAAPLTVTRCIAAHDSEELQARCQPENRRNALSAPFAPPPFVHSPASCPAHAAGAGGARPGAESAQEPSYAHRVGPGIGSAQVTEVLEEECPRSACIARRRGSAVP
jgi:hypothetical protein